MDASSLLGIVRSLTGSNGDLERSKAELEYTHILEENATGLLVGHASLIQDSSDFIDMMYQTVMTGRLFSLARQKKVDLSDPSSDSMVQEALFSLFGHKDLPKHMYNQVSDVIFRAASFYCPLERWNGFSGVLLSLCQTDSSSILSMCLDCLLLCLQAKLIPIFDFDDLFLYITSKPFEPSVTLAALRIVYFLYSESAPFSFFSEVSDYFISLLPELSEADFSVAISNIPPSCLEMFSDSVYTLSDILLSFMTDASKEELHRVLALEVLLDIYSSFQSELSSYVFSLLEVLINLHQELPEPVESALERLSSMPDLFSESSEIITDHLTSYALSGAPDAVTFLDKLLPCLMVDPESFVTLLISLLESPNSCLAAFSLFDNFIQLYNGQIQVEYSHLFFPLLLSLKPSPPLLKSLSVYISQCPRELVESEVGNLFEYLQPLSPSLSMPVFASISEAIHSSFQKFVPAIFDFIRTQPLSMHSISSFSIILKCSGMTSYFEWVLDQISKVDRLSLTPEETEYLDDTIRLMVFSGIDLSILVDQLIEHSERDLSHNVLPMNCDRSQIIFDISFVNKVDLVYEVYEREAIKRKSDSLMSLSFVLALKDDISESMQGRIWLVLENCFRYAFSYDIISSACDCLEALLASADHIHDLYLHFKVVVDTFTSSVKKYSVSPDSIQLFATIAHKTIRLMGEEAEYLIPCISEFILVCGNEAKNCKYHEVIHSLGQVASLLYRFDQSWINEEIMGIFNGNPFGLAFLTTIGQAGESEAIDNLISTGELERKCAAEACGILIERGLGYSSLSTALFRVISEDDAKMVREEAAVSVVKLPRDMRVSQTAAMLLFETLPSKRPEIVEGFAAVVDNYWSEVTSEARIGQFIKIIRKELSEGGSREDRAITWLKRIEMSEGGRDLLISSIQSWEDWKREQIEVRLE